MIYVTIGHAGPFDRLTDAMKCASCFDEEVVIGKNLSREEHARMIQAASVVVTHAGAGTILQTWEARKVPVVVPRRKQYGEHIDDHQMEFTKALEPYGLVIAVYDIKDLAAAIRQAKTTPFPGTHKGDLAEKVAEALKKL